MPVLQLFAFTQTQYQTESISNAFDKGLTPNLPFNIKQIQANWLTSIPAEIIRKII